LAVTTQSLVGDPGSVAEIALAIASGKTDPVKLLEASLRRVDAVEP
jgi:hypothetical protein